MIRSIWNSRSGMAAQMDKLDTISNNMANSTTVGYKRVDVKFNDLMQEDLNKLGYPVSEGKRQFTGSGVKSTEIERDNTQGNLMQTNMNTDLAIDGKGYFKVIDSEGKSFYTRGGSFSIDSSGTIVDKSGNKLVILDAGGANINRQGTGFTNDSFIVDNSGYIRSDKHRGLRIPIYDTIGDSSMKSIGDSLYVPKNDGNTRKNIIESKDFSLLQGFTEQSNVDLGREMSELIITQRAFQLNSTALKTADEMWGMANNLRGR